MDVVSAIDLFASQLSTHIVGLRRIQLLDNVAGMLKTGKYDSDASDALDCLAILILEHLQIGCFAARLLQYPSRESRGI